MGGKFAHTAVCFFLGSSVAASANAELPDTRFPVLVLNASAEILSRSAGEDILISQIFETNIRSGVSEVRDYTTLIQASKGHLIDHIKFRDTDIDVMLTSATANTRRCFDGLLLRFYPAGDKLSVQYTVTPDQVCPVALRPIPNPLPSVSNSND